MCIHVRQLNGMFLASKVPRCDCNSSSRFTLCVHVLYFQIHRGKETEILARKKKKHSANGFYDTVAYLQDPGYQFCSPLTWIDSHPFPIPSDTHCSSGVYN